MTVDAVVRCEDARAALSSGHDAVVLDIGLPDGSGLDLLREWRRQGMTVPILLLTARNFVEDRVEGLGRRSDGSRRKPFDMPHIGCTLPILRPGASARAATR